MEKLEKIRLHRHRIQQRPRSSSWPRWLQEYGVEVILHLAFQSIGIVYGDIGTSPLYVFNSTFTNGINHNDDILGVLSMIFSHSHLDPFG
ncbi:hypothetical protein RGQ29_008432 [Quercus rubra]|uniref:K+ potassium transporter integral membrane domain-containing protein n=1 Tax=Quercus rubra TaxID=3512 RepID=A0AAN7E043_QUERU|nr:hypothetical protein RGQ29_008432 [Quercus rubra]KAK4559179.1 hypothetical protein RGQ29_008432 [Quercus rubra]